MTWIDAEVSSLQAEKRRWVEARMRALEFRKKLPEWWNKLAETFHRDVAGIERATYLKVKVNHTREFVALSRPINDYFLTVTLDSRSGFIRDGRCSLSSLANSSQQRMVRLELTWISGRWILRSPGVGTQRRRKVGAVYCGAGRKHVAHLANRSQQWLVRLGVARLCRRWFFQRPGNGPQRRRQARTLRGWRRKPLAHLANCSQQWLVELVFPRSPVIRSRLSQSTISVGFLNRISRAGSIKYSTVPAEWSIRIGYSTREHCTANCVCAPRPMPNLRS